MSGVSKSASSLIPSDPSKVMVIRSITPELTTFSTPFLRFGRIKIGGRATLVRLASGNLAVFSPVALTDEVRSTVASKGQLKYIGKSRSMLDRGQGGLLCVDCGPRGETTS